LAPRTYDKYECNKFIPSEIIALFKGTLSDQNIDSSGKLVDDKGNEYKTYQCKGC
jgi:hypothetical protein